MGIGFFPESRRQSLSLSVLSACIRPPFLCQCLSRSKAQRNVRFSLPAIVFRLASFSVISLLCRCACDCEKPLAFIPKVKYTDSLFQCRAYWLSVILS
jgi:hypothetical protein